MDAPVAAVPPPAPNTPIDEEAPLEGDAGRTAAIANVPQRSVERRVPDLPCPFVIHRLMGTHGEPNLHVTYSHPFRIVVVMSLAAILLWMVHFVLEVLPTSTKASEGACHSSDDQLRQNALVLFAYFVCVAFIRICMFFPGVAARVGGMQIDNEGMYANQMFMWHFVCEILCGCVPGSWASHVAFQIGNEGVWRMYALHMILHGPLYIFGMGSVLFATQLLISPKCEDEPGAHRLHQELRWYAHFSCAVFVVCFVLAHFHGRLIINAARRQQAEKRRAPNGALENVPAYIYKNNKDLFGDDKDYSAECPICLMEWEDDDIIKVLHCGHSFHKDCIGAWMATERTCAFCRQDVVDGRRAYANGDGPHSTNVEMVALEALPEPAAPSEEPEAQAMVALEALPEPAAPSEQPEVQVIDAVRVEPNTIVQVGVQIVPRQQSREWCTSSI